MNPATAPQASKKETYWLGCREKSCCHNTKVVVTGKDVWRIARAMELKPWDFTLYTEAGEDAVDGFKLARGGISYRVILSKGSARAAKPEGEEGEGGVPCIFLWKTADGHAQCGLGALRPLVCLSFPAVLADRMLYVENSACTCRRWSVGDLEYGAELNRLHSLLEETDEYSRIVDEWNGLVEGERAERTYREFCLYILRAYDNLFTAGKLDNI